MVSLKITYLFQGGKPWIYRTARRAMYEGLFRFLKPYLIMRGEKAVAFAFINGRLQVQVVYLAFS